ncbi:MAG: tetratricopeptide repeat protein [Stenomitos frigidus ULC029]
MLDTGQLQLGGEALLWFRQGLAAAATDAYEQAVTYYDRVIDVRPDYYEVWYERGLSLEKCGSYPEAIASFDRALNLRPKGDASVQIWHDRGNALQYGLGRYTEAIESYDRVLQINPSHEHTWQSRGNALLYGLGQPTQAITSYDRVLHINPDNSLAWRNRGNALVELHRYAEAIASYDRALTIKPDDDVSWHARHLASQRSGLNHRPPTTHPAWYGAGFSSTQTFVEGDLNSSATFAPLFDHSSGTVLGLQDDPILVIEDDRGKRDITLDRDQYQLGRDPQSDICLHSQFASRHHAILTKVSKDDGSYGYHITDGDLDGKASTNGLLINGQKYRVWELKPEDVVVFGPKVQATYRRASL